MKLSSVDFENGGRPLEMDKVTLTFNGRPALRNVSLQLESGQMLILTGFSGSGKSVLLRLCVGLMEPDEGRILIHGRDIATLRETDLFDLRSRSMGIVFQEDTLFTSLSVYDNTAYRLVEHDWPEDQIDVAVKEILEFVGLLDDIDKLPEELSIGMRRRLEIARALVGWPSIMLFDEPTAGLDPLNARQVLDLVIRARDVHGISSIYVTKELHEITYLAGHHARGEGSAVSIVEGPSASGALISVIALKEGSVVFRGTPGEFHDSSVPEVIELKDEAISRGGGDTLKDPWSPDRKPTERIVS